ncbi:MAG: hypothetical protein WD512_04230 [Candidatus Paceibacterota bacterium]
MKKKGQLAGLSGNILMIVVTVMILVLGLIIIQQMRDLPTLTASESGSANNETLITVAESGENFAAFSYPASVCSVSAVTNATSGTVIPASNYTLTNCNIRFTSGNSLGFNNSNWNLSYTFTYGGAAFTSTNTSLIGLGGFADFIPLIVLAVAAAVIIGLILAGFASRGLR